MDHHCVFTDNCVGKDNFKYFFSFIIWSFITLSNATIMVLIQFYYVNTKEDYGAFGILHALDNTPNKIFFDFMMGTKDSMSWNMATFDGVIIGNLIGLICLVCFPGGFTLQNIYNKTSEVMKLKAQKQ